MRTERRKHRRFLLRILFIDLRDLFGRFMLGR
jgi:hypothetical protein